MKTTASPLLLLLLIIAVCCHVASAQGFSVSISPRNQTTTGSAVDYTITVTPHGNFTASVFLNAYSPTLDADFKLVTTVNAPYSSEVLTVLPRLPKQPGTHTIVVEGKNGPVTARDTCTLTLTVVGKQGWINYTASNSALPDDHVNALAIDRSGIVWAATENGLASFDGTAWHSIEDTLIAGRRVLALAIDSTNRIWAVTNGWSGRTGNIWTISGRAIAANGTKGVWIVADIDYRTRKLQFFNGDNAVEYGTYPGDHYGTPPLVASNESGTLWIADDTLSSIAYDGTFWTVGTPLDIGSEDITGLAVDKHNNVWVGSSEGITRLSTSSQPVFYPASETGFPGTRVTEFGFDYQGNTWLGMTIHPNSWEAPQPRGLGRYDGTNWWHYTTANSALLSNDITGIATTPSTIWIAMNGGGVIALDASASPNALLDVPTGDIASINRHQTFIYPNPAINTTTVHLSITASASIKIALKDGLGRDITVIADRFYQPGKLQFPVDTEHLAPGMYYLETAIDNQRDVRPVIVVH